ncbi:hypothetical protein ACWDE9_33855 [Streptomyces olivaceoviridis]
METPAERSLCPVIRTVRLRQGTRSAEVSLKAIVTAVRSRWSMDVRSVTSVTAIRPSTSAPSRRDVGDIYGFVALAWICILSCVRDLRPVGLQTNCTVPYGI